MNDSNRQAISKKLRFEVFKRDSFTCQYCGRKAPEVVLEIDHIKDAVSTGATIESLKSATINAKNISEWRSILTNYLEGKNNG